MARLAVILGSAAMLLLSAGCADPAPPRRDDRPFPEAGSDYRVFSRNTTPDVPLFPTVDRPFDPPGGPAVSTAPPSAGPQMDPNTARRLLHASQPLGHDLTVPRLAGPAVVDANKIDPRAAGLLTPVQVSKTPVKAAPDANK